MAETVASSARRARSVQMLPACLGALTLIAGCQGQVQPHPPDRNGPGAERAPGAASSPNGGTGEDDALDPAGPKPGQGAQGRDPSAPRACADGAIAHTMKGTVLPNCLLKRRDGPAELPFGSAAPIPRRAVLRGLGGLAIALPLLDAFGGDRARAQSAPTAKRFILFFEHGGYISAADKDGRKFDGNGAQNGVDAWAPAPGEALKLGAYHQPIAAHADSLLVLRGINNRACQKQSPYNGDHGWANVTALTSANATALSDDEQTSEGPSIDAVLAERLQQRDPAPFPSLHLMVPAHNYGTPFFRAARQPSSGEYNPVKAFDKLFAGVTTGSDQPDPAALRARQRKQSILDGVSEGLRLFQQRVSSRDRATIDAHLTHIRELEARLADVQVAPACSKPVLTGQNPKADYYSVQIEKSGPAMVDVLIAALRCGLTNVAGFEIGDFYAQFVKPTFPAAYDIGHSLDHSARDVGKTGPDGARWQDWYETILRNRQWRMGLLARFLDGLAATPEGAGTMLDNSLVLWTSEFSTGAEHSVADLPVLLAGKAGGQLRTGRHINYNLKAASDPTTREYQTETSLHNLFTTVLNLFGESDTHFGSDHAWKQGPLSGLS